MKKIVRLTESDLTRIVKKTINENINQSSEDFRSICRRVTASLDDLKVEMKKGDARKTEESKDAVKHHIRRMENIIDELKRKLR
jgi:DNA-binding transcriptional regulator WhiA